MVSRENELLVDLLNVLSHIVVVEDLCRYCEENYTVDISDIVALRNWIKENIK